MPHRFTLGVEEEFQIVDPQTWELRSHVSELVEPGATVLGDQIKRELHQSIVEVGTTICRNTDELEAQVHHIRRELTAAAESRGLAIAAAGTHPFSHWIDQVLSPGERYEHIVEELQMLARSLLIFGLHVHVGIKDRSLAFQIMNEALYFLPHLLALSTNSPFWLGRNTGLKSYRTKVFDRFPRTSMPEYFETPAEFDEFVRILVKTNSIDNGKKIWWDVRPHPFFETIEFRVCDVPMRLDETVTLAALFQAICVKLYKLRLQNLGFRRYRRALILENKWRASRYGIAGKLIDFGKEVEVPFPDLIAEMLEFLDDVVDELGTRREVFDGVNWILKNGSGADRQLRIYEATGGDLKKVVDYICEETTHGLPVQAPVNQAASR